LGERSSLIARAHVPFVQPHAPIDFRRVIFHRSPMEEKKDKCKRERRRLRSSGFGFWASLPLRSAFVRSRQAQRLATERSNQPSCLGFCLSQVCGHALVHSVGLDPAESSVPKGLSRTLHPLVGLRPANPPVAYIRSYWAKRRTSLQRLSELMPCPSGQFECARSGRPV